MWTLARRVLPGLLCCAVIAGAAPAIARQGERPEGHSSFQAAAATADVTPPPWTPQSDSAFVPACGPDPSTIQQAWPGERPFQLTEPYVNIYGPSVHRYAPGDPYCDANHNGRFDAPYIAGGSGQNHWPTSTDTANPIRAQVLLFAQGDRKIALVVVDSIGLFNTGMDLIRQAAAKVAPDVNQIFVSSTHDESAPDPIGLWGPDDSDLPTGGQAPTAVSSGVDDYYLQFMADRTAAAIKQADQSLQPAALRLAEAHIPSNVQSCWSSYPYIDDQQMPVLQAVAADGSHVIATLVDVGTHAETYAFSGDPTLKTRFSSDWPGQMRTALEQQYPGSIGIEMAGLVGSVETPTVYEPESTQVSNVPGPVVHQDRTINPNDCSSVYPNPATGTPVSDPVQYLSAYGQSVAHTAEAALAAQGQTSLPRTLSGQDKALCLPLENNLFKAAFAAGLFPDRPLFSDPSCLVATSPDATGGPADQLYLRTDVAVVTVGPAQFAYSPGEVFPFTEIRGPIDMQQEPFPTSCYDPSTDSYYCGTPLPMSPWIAADMTAPYHFMAGLGQDMIGYLFPPGNFVGDQGETSQSPWGPYHAFKDSGANDRFGHHHSDDSESLGPHAGLAVAQGLASLLQGARVQPPHQVVPGLFVDAGGHLSDSPFADQASGFGGAVGIEVVVRKGATRTLTYGRDFTKYATFDSLPDPGTAGTGLPYSVSTAGVFVRGGAVLIDVFEGAKALLPPPAS